MNRRFRSFLRLAGCLAACLLLSCGFAGSGEGVIPEGERRLVASAAYLDSDGAEHRLAEHIGKVVLVDVWATWCPPCRRALPEIAALQAREDADYMVLAISVDRKGWDDVRPFLNAHPRMGLRAALPSGRDGLEPFGAIPAIPTTLVVDRHGRLRERWSGYYEGRAQTALRDALKEP